MTPAERSLLRLFVSDARAALYRDFEQQLPAYGIFFQLAVGAAGALPNYTNLHLTAPADLPNADRATRALAARLQERLQYLATTLPGTAPQLASALPRLLLEQAYTFLNRLTALRLAEEREIVMECLRRGRQSEGFVELFSLYTDRAYETGDARYAAFVRANFDRLARELPGLFGAYSPYGLLWPRQAAFDTVLAHLRRPELAFAWDADETLGWLYQYFNSDAERQEMRARSRAPRTSREMAVRNQFFTPRYVVEFLTDNTLGRRWLDVAGTSEALLARCRYLTLKAETVSTAAPAEAPAPVASTPERRAAPALNEEPEPFALPDPRALRVLDPACGSMHFGLYAYDVFETIYLDAWDRLPAATVLTDVRAALAAEFPDDAEAQRKAFQARVPGLIMAHNLHGIDIDPRAIQVAGLTLWLRAHRSWQRLKVRAALRPRIQEARLVWAEPLADGELLAGFARTLRSEVLPGQTKPLAPAEAQVLGDLLRSVAHHTRLVGEAGWLIPLERELASLIEAARQQWQEARVVVTKATQTDMFRGAPAQQLSLSMESLGRVRKAFFAEAEELLLAALTLYAEQAAGPDAYQRQLFAADAARTLALVDLCRLRYDVVLMNPPFGAAAAASKTYLDQNYPSSKMDIFAMFIDRALRRLKPGGFVGIISSRTGLFITSFKVFREQILLRHHMPLVADLGGEVLDATVETAAYVVQQIAPLAQPTTFLRLLHVPGEEKAAALIEGLSRANLPTRFDVPTSAFEVLPNQPLAYWAPNSIREAFVDEPAFSESAGKSAAGLQTSDDFRFVRLWYETQSQPWKSFAKGGKYFPFYNDLYTIINWGLDGFELKAWLSRNGESWSRSIRSPSRYFQPGLTYPRRSHALSVQPMPAGTVISVRGTGIYPTPSGGRNLVEQNLLNLAVLASQPFDYMLKLGLGFSARPQFDGGAINRTPFPASLQLPVETPAATRLMALAQRGHAVQRAREFIRETSLHFRLPALLLPASLAGPADMESLPAELAGIAVSLPNEENTTLADAAAAEAARADARRQEVEAIQSEINDRVYAAYGFGPADRAAIQQFYAAPSSTDEEEADEDEEDDSLAAGSPADTAFALWQWLMGAAFGRWDVRLALHPEQLPAPAGPFEALPAAPPGALRRPGSDKLVAGPGELVSAPEAETETTAPAYPVPVAWSGLLPLDADHPHDLVRQLRQLLTTLRPNTAAALETESRTLLASPRADLTGWLSEWLAKGGAGGFFARHLAQYSRSKREAPLYWPMQAPGTSYVLWLYAPRLSRETLYAAINDYLDPRRTRARDELRQLTELLGGPAPANAREARQQEQRRDVLTQLVAGLTQFIDHLSGVLENPGFQPHPDDGAVISACMLAELFALPAWRRKLEQHRAKLHAARRSLQQNMQRLPHNACRAPQNHPRDQE